MQKGFSEKSKEFDSNNKNITKTQKGFNSFLKGKKLTYTLPGKRQISAFAIIVLSLNFLFLIGIILYFKNPLFHNFIFNLGR